jgi:D-alanine-D-alanine ligase-like ATP-grasp enzyme
MAKTKYEIELETKLMKAWAENVYERHLREQAVRALNDLNCRAHSGYDFNADPDQMTLKVGSVLMEQWPQFDKVAAHLKASNTDYATGG